MASETIIQLIKGAIARAASSGELPPLERCQIELERPKHRGHGDWATTVAMSLASKLGKNPLDIANLIVDNMEDAPEILDRVEVAKPGFINFHLTRDFLRGVLFEIHQRKEEFGASKLGGGKKIQVEFVSANPVGPLHVGHGRWAALGDTLSNVLEHCGYNVTREFYVNDYGTQMQNFGRSISARYAELRGRKVTFPEDGYAGEYILALTRRIAEEYSEDFLELADEERSRRFTEIAYPWMLDSIKDTLNSMGVRFDVWSSERRLYESGAVKKLLTQLEKESRAYWKDGALWLKTSSLGDEKDRVLVRSNGEPTYFASDIAYHADKMRRGFERVIDIWGADHHGYVSRMKAAMKALGYPPDWLEIILGQLVRLYRGGEPFTMSKRTGEIITLDELIEEVGKDAARYFFLQRSHDSPLDFDIELAKKESPENPVYYVQYAHARISSILRHAHETGVGDSLPSASDLELLSHQTEIELLRCLGEFPEVVELCATKRSPHRLTGYAEDLSSKFHVFYRDCRVVSEDEPLTRARMFLARGVKQVLQIVLGLIGVDAPEKM